MAKKKPNYKIPMLPNGTIPNCAGWAGEETETFDGKPIAWVDPEPFEATLRFHQFYRRRSGASVELENVKTGAVYTMKLEDFGAVLRDNVAPRWFEGTWIAFKGGQNFNIVRHES